MTMLLLCMRVAWHARIDRRARSAINRQEKSWLMLWLCRPPLLPPQPPPSTVRLCPSACICTILNTPSPYPPAHKYRALGLKGEESLISSSVECVAGTMAAASGWPGASVLGRPTDLLRTSDHRSDVPRLIDAMRPRSIGSARSVPQPPDGHTSPWCQCCYSSVCLAC